MTTSQRLESYGDGDEAAAHRGSGGTMLGVRCFGQVGDAYAAEQVLDGVVDLAQWFFDGAMAGKVASSVNGDAAGDEQRAVDGANYFKGRDFHGRTGGG